MRGEVAVHLCLRRALAQRGQTQAPGEVERALQPEGAPRPEEPLRLDRLLEIANSIDENIEFEIECTSPENPTLRMLDFKAWINRRTRKIEFDFDLKLNLQKKLTIFRTFRI